MKILHTADWYLGANLEGKSRMEEQIAILDEIAMIADEQNVDVVLIAGDVFVNPNMPSYADHLFEKALIKLSKNGNRAVVAVSGNNDILERFVATREFALTQNCFLFNNLNTDFDEASIAQNKAIKLTDYGKGYIELTKNGEKVVIAFMPYPSFFGEEKSKTRDEAVVNKIKRLLNLASVGFKNDSFNIVLGHFFVPAKPGDKDDYFELPIDALPNGFDYAALGHVDELTVVSEEKNIYYPGATTNQYYQTKKQKNYVIVLDVNGKTIKTKQFIKLKTPKTMLKITASDYTDAVNKLNSCDADYVRLVIKTLKKDEFKKLKDAYPNLTNVSMMPEKLKSPNKNLSSSLNDEKVFSEFYKKEYGKEPSSKLLSTFKAIIKGDEE